ncbi:hypothetical protein BCV69DRAFT_279934 [Microstroma glucosiphilum]|uniref:Uncharacterized protein n=1 Tax=Pseudomicrostroma glucosiphilum TaxID=1684307 RepID=A0A316UFM8_9BASI|nr:hypothetical protein BCV69DRAFT_279934 [Pseudomicrostroma glucosiphilum]PWN24030.1 hypothetical protein BCV69DRAFT_279934 [Pseudomicrostroma glucosiphilum]
MTAAPVSAVDRSAAISAAPAPLKGPTASTSYLVFLPPPKESRRLLRDRSINTNGSDSRTSGSDAKWKRGRSRHFRRGGEEEQWVEADRASVSRSSSSIHRRTSAHVRHTSAALPIPKTSAAAVTLPARPQGDEGHSENVRQEVLVPAAQSEYVSDGGTRFKPRSPIISEKRNGYLQGGRTRSAQDPLVGHPQSDSSEKSHSTSSGSSLELTPAGEAALRLRNARTVNHQLAAVPLIEVPNNLSYLISPGLGRGTGSGVHYSSRLDDGTSWTETLVTGLAEREQELTGDISHTHLGKIMRSGLGGHKVQSASGSVVVSPASRVDDTDETRRYRLDEEERAFLAGPFSLGSTSIGLALKCQAGEEPLRHAEEGFSGGSQENISISRALRSESEVRALEMEKERIRREREEDEDGLSVWPAGKDKRGKVRFVSAREAMQDPPKGETTSSRGDMKKRGLKRGPTQGHTGSQESPGSQNGRASNASQTEEEEEIPLTPVRRKRLRLEPPTPLPTPSARSDQVSNMASKAEAQIACHCQCQRTSATRGAEAQSRPGVAATSRADEAAADRSGPASAEQSRSVVSPIKRAKSDPKPISSTPLLAPLAPLPSSSDPSPRNRRQMSASTSALTSLSRVNQSVCRFSIFTRRSADASTSTSASRSRVLRKERDREVSRPTMHPTRPDPAREISVDASRSGDASVSHQRNRQRPEARHDNDSAISRSDFVPPTMREERDDLPPPHTPRDLMPAVQPLSPIQAPAEGKTAEKNPRVDAPSTKDLRKSVSVAKTASKTDNMVPEPPTIGNVPPHREVTISKPSTMAAAASTTNFLDLSTSSSERPTTSRPQRPPPVPIPPLRTSTSTKSHGPSKLAQSLTAESLDRSLNMGESCESVGQSSNVRGQTMTMTGLDSIPPPPALHFDPREVTSLLSILRNPIPHLPAKHGGYAEQITSPRIDVLVLIREIGALEEIGVKVFSKGKVVEGRVDMMARSELVVMDGEGSISRVVLWGHCALEWAGAEHSGDATEEEEFETSGEHSHSTRAGMTTTMDTTSFRGDETTTYGGVLLRDAAQHKSASKSAVVRKDKHERRPVVGPLRPGDVVCLSSLIVSPTPTKSSGPPQRATVTRAQPASVQLVASERTSSRAELCWRWDLRGREKDRERGRRKYRFDVALADFDRRCKEVWKCATRWDGERD